MFPGNRYPHEPVIHFVADIGRLDNVDGHVKEAIDLNKRKLEEYLKSDKTLNKTVLDIGFGTIADLIMLMDFGYKGYGIEVSNYAIQCAKKAVDYYKYPITISKYKPSNLEFSANFFDLIISNASIYYNVHFEKFVRETHRVLNEGGYFFHRVIAKDHGYFENNYADHCHSNVYEWVRYPIAGINGLQFVCYDKDEIFKIFSKYFNGVKVSYLKYDYQALKQSWWIVTGKK